MSTDHAAAIRRLGGYVSQKLSQWADWPSEAAGPQANVQEMIKHADDLQAERDAALARADEAERRLAAYAKPKWWDVLGVSPDATREEISTAYRTLIRQHNPDTGGNAIQFQAVIAAIKQAKKALLS